MTQTEIAGNIKQKVLNAESILILASTPIDYDSVGTALSIKWWLEELGKKNVSTYAFTNIPSTIKHFPGLEQLQQKHPDKVDLASYDLVITLDGNSWRQFFTSKYEQYLALIKKERIVNIDHHQPGEIERYIPETTLKVKDTSTAKVFYDYFIKDSGLKLNLDVATWMYMSIVGDTGNFSFEIYKDTFGFAQLLLEYGVDHYAAVNFVVPKPMMDFTLWAIQNTQYYPEVESTILAIDTDKRNQLVELFGKDWESNDLARYYQKVFMHMVDGFPYGIIFKVGKSDDKTRVVWRTRHIGGEIEIMKILNGIGFKANGHRNAGGGITDMQIPEATEKFIQEMIATKTKLSISNE